MAFMQWQIFGPHEDEALDVNAAKEEMRKLTESVNAYGSEHGQSPKSIEEVALGFIRVANEAMSRPIRSLTQMKVCEHHALIPTLDKVLFIQNALVKPLELPQNSAH